MWDKSESLNDCRARVNIGVLVPLPAGSGGFKFHGQNKDTGGGGDDPVDKIIYDRYFQGKTSGTAIEAGANDGLYLSTCLVFEDMGWNVINIEASEENYRKLVVNRLKSINHFKALSDVHGGEIKINHFGFDNGGMDGNPDNVTRCTKGKAPVSSNLVTTARYDELIKEPIDLFVLDVEGMEAEVIAGMARTLYWPKIFCIEFPHVGLERIFSMLADKYTLDYHDDLNAIMVKR